MERVARVVQLINSFSRGGAERFAVDLALGLRERGFEPLVCGVGVGSDEQERSWRAQLESSGIQTESLGRGGIRRWVSRALMLRRLLYDWRADLLHIHSISPVAIPVQGMLPTVYTFHSERMLGSSRKRAQAVELILSRRSAACVAVSEAARRTAIRRNLLSPERVRVIHNGMQGKRLLEQSRQADRLLADLGRPIALAIGRVDANKGHDLLVEALLACRPTLHLAIVGSLERDPPFVAKLRRRIHELRLAGRVHLLGEHANVAALVAASDLVVLPSKSESFGLAALEAVALAKPVLVSDIAAHRELLAGPERGALVSRRTPQEWARAMEEALDGHRRYDLAEAAGRILGTYDISRSVEQYAALYRSVVNHPEVALESE